MAQEAALTALATLHQAGHSAWLVGGCVRDLLLGITPKDFDIATSALPEQIFTLFPHAQLVGAHFGVVLLSAHLEAATYRSDLSYQDGRRPSGVVFHSDPSHDAARRDFTINALYLDPLSGRSLDFHGGRHDLQSGLIRAIGDPAARFAEDHLRLLRAIRFAARFGFTIEPATLAALATHAPSIRRIAPERIHDEMRRILTGPRLDLAWQLLSSTGLWAALVPEAPAGSTLARLTPPASLPLAWAALLQDIPSPQNIFNRFRFSAAERRDTLFLLPNQSSLLAYSPLSRPHQKRLLRHPLFPNLLALHLATHGPGPTATHWLTQQSRWSHSDLWPTPLFNGDSLIARGLPPGPHFRQILARLEDLQLTNPPLTLADALTILKL
ncbi:MAG: CCA tRNA nucleotidyltransferase [Acidobacteriota bacterium]